MMQDPMIQDTMMQDTMMRCRMMRTCMLAVSLVACSITSSPARAAGEAAGSAAASYLSVGSGASVLAMAGATLASGRDLAAATWNPASLARVDALEFSISHTPLPGGATQDWLAAGGRLWGGSTRWGLNTLFHQEPGLEGRDALNQPTGAISVSDLALGANLARPLGPHASAGFGVQWLHESLAGSNGAGLAFDAGVSAQAGAFGLGLAARHLGGAMRYGDSSYELPAVVAAGASWSDELRGLRVNADFESPSHYYRAVRVGGEWMWRERLALRAGYRRDLGAPALEAMSGATFGMGTGALGAWMDYAFSPGGGEGLGQHRVGITFRPRRPGLPGLSGKTSAEARPRNVVTSLSPAAPRVDVAEPSPRRRASPYLVAPVARVAPPATKQQQPAGEAQAPKLDAPLVSPAAPAAPVAPVARPSSVVVAEGQTMATIARRWDTTVPAIMMTNDLVSDRVHLGQRLRLPAARRR